MMHHRTAFPATLSSALEYTEAAAWAQYYRPTATPQSKLAIIASATAGAIPEVDTLALNRVIGLGLAASVSPADVDRAVAFYRRARVPRFLVQHPTLGNPALPNWLRSRGFTAHHTSTKLLCVQPTAFEPLTTGLRIERIDRSRATVYGNILCAGLGWHAPGMNTWLASAIGKPKYYHYLVFFGKLPIAAGAMYVNKAYASLFLSATRPDFQEQGAQALLTQTGLAEAQALGCKYIITETDTKASSRCSGVSLENLAQLGFKEVYQRQHFLYSF